MILSLPFQKLKGLVRHKTTNSMPNPMAMVGRALMSNKSPSAHRSHSNSSLLSSPAVVSTGVNGSSARESAISEAFGSKDAGLMPNKHRAFLMDTQVKYTVVSGIHSISTIV